MVEKMVETKKPPTLEQRRDSLEAQKRNLIANVNGVEGALQLIRDLIAERDGKDAEEEV